MFAFLCRRSVFAILVAGTSIGALQLAAAEIDTIDPSSNAEWVAIPSGIADAAGKTAYITAINDGVEALDMANGHTLWETKHAHRPVALVGNRLVAIEPRGTQEPANTMGVAVLDAKSGQVLVGSQPIVFPDWIAVDGGIGLGFSSTVAMEGNTLLLRWHAWRQFAGGVAPSAAAVAAAQKDETGIARIDLDTGHTEVHVEAFPKEKSKSFGRFTDVGDVRLIVSEREEKVPNGVQLIHRTLEASNKHTGRPLWQHEICSDLIVPANITQQAQSQMMQSESRR